MHENGLINLIQLQRVNKTHAIDSEHSQYGVDRELDETSCLRAAPARDRSRTRRLLIEITRCSCQRVVGAAVLDAFYC